ncbi:hypothetical protein Tco_0685776 [Tanacetum coccineum]
MFRGDASRVALDNTNGTTDLLYGTYDCVVKCRVKRVLATTVGGYYFFSLILQRRCNEQENMVRIYEIRFDGEYYQIAMEICQMNFNELLKHRFKGRHASRYKKRFLRSSWVVSLILSENRCLQEEDEMGWGGRTAADQHLWRWGLGFRGRWCEGGNG